MPPQTKSPSLDLPLICRAGRGPATWGAETEESDGGFLKHSHETKIRNAASAEVEPEPERMLGAKAGIEPPPD